MKEASVQELLDNDIIELSFKESDDDRYPSLSKDHLNQSIFRDDMRTTSGIKRSSFNLEESYEDKSVGGLSQSLSALNASVQEETTLKSKFKPNRSELRESDYPTEKELWEFNQSIFTDRVGNQVVGLNRKSSDKERHSQEEINEQVVQPFEMQPAVAPLPPEPKNKLDKSSRAGDIKVILRSTNYFLEKSNGDSAMVNGEMLRDLYDEFFKQELFIPLFKYDRFDEWNNAKDKFNPDLQAHRIFKITLERYVEYISTKYPNEFEQVFKILQEIQRGRVSKKREQSAFTFLNFDLTSIVESLKHYISSPKTEILRNSLLSKIRCLQEAARTTQRHTDLTGQAQAMREVIEELWWELGQVELLLNFEQTEYYCSKKIENSPELKFREIWIKYRDFIRMEKTHHTEANLRSILI